MCGFCRAGCPVYKETSLESKNARGRITLVCNMLKGRTKIKVMDITEVVAQVLE
ncbi:MAG: hypothetical protein ACE5I8_03645 [Thermodesulfobacteriota bacterium]